MVVSDVQGPLINTDICFILQMIALIPLTSAVLCISFAVLLHFDKVTQTHCKQNRMRSLFGRPLYPDFLQAQEFALCKSNVLTKTLCVVRSSRIMTANFRRNPLLEIDLVLLAKTICVLPLISSASCVVVSVLLHFEQVTKSHCKVPNYLPSISAATGDYSPEKYIWRIGIAYHSFMRLIAVVLEHRILYNRVIGAPSTCFIWMTRIKAILLIVENLALVMLTYISSDDNYSVHEKSFILFMVAGMLHMLLSCLLRYKTSKLPISHEERRSLQRKVTLVLINYSSFATAIYFFFRHNWYCEPGVYSLFAFCEYVVVFSNILFHSTIIDDLQGVKLFIGHVAPTTATKYH